MKTASLLLKAINLYDLVKRRKQEICYIFHTQTTKRKYYFCLWKLLEALIFYSRNDGHILDCDFNATPLKPNLTLFWKIRIWKSDLKLIMFLFFQWLKYWFNFHKQQLILLKNLLFWNKSNHHHLICTMLKSQKPFLPDNSNTYSINDNFFRNILMLLFIIKISLT